MFILNILAFIFVLGLVIMLHELGHFIMARRAGILCHEFAIGMGPIVYSKKKGETLYSVRAIPIGGFVSMAGEEINDDLVKVGKDIKVRKENGRITHIILNPEDERYPSAERVTVEFVDLKAQDGEALMINHMEVDEKAFYVLKDKKIQIAPYNRQFDSKTLWQRFTTIFAGPMMNFILAFFLFAIIAMVVGFPKTDAEGNTTLEIGHVQAGQPAYGNIEVGDTITHIDGEPVQSWEEMHQVMSAKQGQREILFTVDRDGQSHDYTLTPVIFLVAIGIQSEREEDVAVWDPEVVRIGNVINNGPAASAGLQTGDLILSVDGNPVPDWTTLIEAVRANAEGSRMLFEVERDGATETFEVEPYQHDLIESQGAPVVQSRIGISPVHERDIPRALFSGSITGIINSSTMIFDTLSMLFSGVVGVGDLAGPVGIYSVTASAFQQGLISLLSWTALLSVNLGILNLLPIPALDGGRIVFLGYEGITRKKVNKTVENYLHLIMFILLITLLLFVTYNDILRLFNLG